MPPPSPGRDWEPVQPQALGPTGGRSAVLGRNALGNRATALGPASKISAQVLRAILSRIAIITTASFLRGQWLAWQSAYGREDGVGCGDVRPVDRRHERVDIGGRPGAIVDV